MTPFEKSEEYPRLKATSPNSEFTYAFNDVLTHQIRLFVLRIFR